MALRVLVGGALLLCLQACAITFTPEESTPVPLDKALNAVARDLNKATPVILSDIETKDGKGALQAAIFARQCAIKRADPPLPVITGPVSLALQGSIQQQKQAGGQVNYPWGGNLSFQVQVTKGQQQQLTVPITFVAASALSSFFLGQNIGNLSALPDSGVPVGFDKTTLETELVRKAAAISNATTEQIDAYKKGEKCPTTPTNEGLGFMAPAISIVLPEATRAQ